MLLNITFIGPVISPQPLRVFYTNKIDISINYQSIFLLSISVYKLNIKYLIFNI